MAFWDDVVRNLFGGGQSSTKSKPKSGAVGRGLQRASRELRPSTTEAPAPQARARQQSPTTFTSVLSGGGGGGGGMRSFSRGNQAPTKQPEPEVPEMTPWDKFVFGQNEQGRQNFRDNYIKTGQGAPDVFGEIGNFFKDATTDRTPNGDKGLESIHEAQKPVDEDASFLDQIGQGQVNQGVEATKDGEDILAWLMEPVNSPGEFFQPVQGTADRVQAAQDIVDARTDLANAFGDRGEVTVRELTTDEWNALTPDQQQGVLSSWALYQASLEDQALAETAPEREEGYDEAVNAIFSEQGGSDTYAPNTVRVLGELGYQNQSADLDNFIDQSALPTYEDILGQSLDNGSSARKDVYSALAGSTAFDNETITSALDRGQNLLDAIRVSGAVSDDFKMFSGVQSDYGDLTEEDFGNLNTLLNNLSNREVFARISSDPELNQRLTDSINEANELYGSDIVSRYFMDSVKTFDNLTDYMSPEEFSQNWLEG